MKRVGVVTGTRADFGLLSRTIKLLQSDKNFETIVFACGSHLSAEYGNTIDEVRNSGVENIVSVEMLLSSSTRVGIAKSIGLATISFADKLSDANLDCLLVLGDRYEILAATQAALILDIPTAHIHGGEVTEGAFDDAIRHSLTKMANIHFPATEEFADRIRQLGEQDDSIFVVGSPGVDNIVNEKRLSKEALEESLGFAVGDKPILVTYHPVTKASLQENDVTPLVEAIKNLQDFNFVITFPNADGGGEKIINAWRSIEHLSHVNLIPSLGFIRYLSLMEHVVAVIGNSSSGIIEVPGFKVPTINIGTRQKGRPLASSVVNCRLGNKDILDSIDKVMSEEFQNSLSKTINPYGDGQAAERIVDVLTKIDFENVRIKKFRDIT